MSEPLVLIDRFPAGYAILTFNRPTTLNALSQALRRQFCAAVDALAADPSVCVLILTGRGRVFSAGLDLKEWQETSGIAGGAFDDDPVRAMARFSGPTIGAINGLAITGGFEIAAACDLLFATPETRFIDTHVHAGLLPGWGLSARLARSIGVCRAKALSLTGTPLTAVQAEAWGFVYRVVQADTLLAEAQALAERMFASDRETLIAYKALIDDGFSMTLADALAMERERAMVANALVDPKVVQARLAILREGNRQG